MNWHKVQLRTLHFSVLGWTCRARNCLKLVYNVLGLIFGLTEVLKVEGGVLDDLNKIKHSDSIHHRILY